MHCYCVLRKKLIFLFRFHPVYKHTNYLTVIAIIAIVIVIVIVIAIQCPPVNPPTFAICAIKNMCEKPIAKSTSSFVLCFPKTNGVSKLTQKSAQMFSPIPSCALS